MGLDKNVQKTISIWKREYKKGLTSYMILLLLRNERLYGYQLCSQLTELMDEKIVFKENAIYGILKQMTKREFVSFEWQDSTKGPKRKYYNITATGLQLIDLFTKEYVNPMLKGLSSLVQEKANKT